MRCIGSSSVFVLAAAAALMACGPRYARHYYVDTALVPAQALDAVEMQATKVAGARNQSRYDERRVALAVEETERAAWQLECDAIDEKLLQPDLDPTERQVLVRRQHHLRLKLRAPVAVGYDHIEVARVAGELHVTSEPRTVDGSTPGPGGRHIARVQVAEAGAGSRIEVALVRAGDSYLAFDSMLRIDRDAWPDCTPSVHANPRTCNIRRGGPLGVNRLAMVDRVRIPGRFDSASVELGSELGMGMDPAIEGTVLRYRMAGRAGMKWGARGGRGHEWQLWSLVGIGPGLHAGNTDCERPCTRSVIGFEPELVLRLSRVPVAEFIPDRRIPVGRGMDLDFRLSGFFDDLDRSGLSAALVVRHPGWGGAFVRAGHMWGEDGGVTWSAGIDLGSFPTLGGLLGGALIAGAIQGLGEGIRDVAVGNQ